MFPVEFDHTVLDSLPLPDQDDTTRVIQILKAIAARRIIPYFKKDPRYGRNCCGEIS